MQTTMIFMVLNDADILPTRSANTIIKIGINTTHNSIIITSIYQITIKGERNEVPPIITLDQITKSTDSTFTSTIDIDRIRHITTRPNRTITSDQTVTITVEDRRRHTHHLDQFTTDELIPSIIQRLMFCHQMTIIIMIPKIRIYAIFQPKLFVTIDIH